MAYHGTKYRYLGAIMEEGLKNGKPDHRESGVFLSPVFKTALFYAGEQETSGISVFFVSINA